jgi:putative ABC transport system permease protein
VQEAAVLRTLGLSRRRLLEAIALEFGILGALAGLIAALSATAVSYALATGVFDLPWRPDLWMWVIAVGGGAAGVSLSGIAATWRLAREPPVVVLRSA